MLIKQKKLIKFIKLIRELAIDVFYAGIETVE